MKKYQLTDFLAFVESGNCCSTNLDEAVIEFKRAMEELNVESIEELMRDD